MTTLIRVIGVLALATALDAARYDGYATRDIVQMLNDLTIGFGFG